MNPSDYSFMKSGFDNVNPPKLDDNYIQNVTTLVTYFAENALRTSAIYTSHSNRKIVTSKDIKRGMMLEVFIYTKRPDFVDKCKQIKEELFENENTSDEEEDIEEESFITNEEEEFKESKCECVLCKSINETFSKWDSWIPENKVEEILKKHINNIQ